MHGLGALLAVCLLLVAPRHGSLATTNSFAATLDLSGTAVQATAECGRDANGDPIEAPFCTSASTCDICNADESERSYPARAAVDGDVATAWQSPPLSQGEEFRAVNFTLDLGQRFTVTSFTLRSGASPLPAVWMLHGSRDGITFTPWRTFEAGDAPQGREVTVDLSQDSPQAVATHILLELQQARAVQDATLVAVFEGCRSTSSKTSYIDDPLELTEKHVSKVYCVSKQDVKATFPHGLPRMFATQTNALGQVCWVLRRQSFDIIQRLETREPRFLLYGEDGCGKTLCMYQVIHWCVRAGWMVVHIPSVYSWTHSRAELRPSTKHPGCYDQPVEATTWLKNFRAANSQFLSEIKLRKDHQWTKKDMSPAGQDLSKVIEQGLMKPNIATEVVSVVLREISSAQSLKLLLTVDSFNGCFNPTSLKTKDKKWMEPEQLSLVRNIMEYVTPGKFPGALLLVLSRSAMFRHSVPGCEPSLLLGEKGMEAVKGYEMVNLPHYERQEMESCLEYYSQKRWLTKELTESVSNELWYVTAGNPKELNRLCSAL